jgi:ABC-type glycerol-3-phosphate transport system substrate-binding protein
MKKFVVFGLILAVVLASCGGGGGSPSAVTKNFITAIIKGDVKGIQANSTEEVASLLTAFIGEDKIEAQLEEIGKFTVKDETIDGDTAKVTVVYESGEEETIDLVKVDGKWKVTIKK